MEQSFQTKAFGGFDKAQVLSYIGGLISQQEQDTLRFQKQISELRTAYDQTKICCDEQKETVDKYSNLLSNAEKMMEERNATIASYETTIQSLKALNQHQKEQMDGLNAQVKRLQEQIDTANLAMAEKTREMEEVTAKAAEFEKFRDRQSQVQAKLNEFLAKAHARADEILDDARTRGEAVISRSNAVAAATYTACAKLKNAVIDLQQASAHLNEALASKANDFESHLDEVKDAAVREQTPAQMVESFIRSNLNEKDE